MFCLTVINKKNNDITKTLFKSYVAVTRKSKIFLDLGFKIEIEFLTHQELMDEATQAISDIYRTAQKEFISQQQRRVK